MRSYASRYRSIKKGDVVKLAREFKTQGGTILAAGLEMRVFNKHGGLHLETIGDKPCPTCGIVEQTVAERIIETLGGFTPISAVGRSAADPIPAPCGFEHPKRGGVKCIRIGECPSDIPHLSIVGTPPFRRYLEYQVVAKKI